MNLDAEKKGGQLSRFGPLFVFMAKKIALKVYFDDQTGEVEEIECTKRFEDEGPIFRLDVIKDTIIALENIYEYERSQLFTNDFNEIGEA